MNKHLIALLIWNLIVMLVYGVDKAKAKAGRRRISEANLLGIAFALGGCGAMLGMVLFNHKTSKKKFRILVPLFAIMMIIVLHLLVQKLPL